jgi:hypothetical protein
MILIIAIDFIVVGVLVAIALTKGVEQALPFFAFVVILVPLESTIFLPGLFQLNTQRVAIVTLAALYFLTGKRNVESSDKRGTPLKYLILLILAWNLISTAGSIVFTTSLSNVLSSALDFYLVYYIFTKTVSEVQTVHRILVAFVAALTVCCVVGWLEIHFSWQVSDLFPTLVHRFTPGQEGLMLVEGRVRSTFPHAILFANGLALGIPLALYLLTLAKTGLQKALLWVSILMMSWNLYKTLSRGPWLALLLSLIVLFVFSKGQIRRYLVIVSLLMVSVLVIRPGVWDTLRNTYVETVDPESARGSSYEYRYALLRVAREALNKDLGRAAWGFGPDSFYHLGLEGEDPSTGHIVKFESCDSAMVELMVDTGYVGLFLVIVLMVKSILVSLGGFIRLPNPQNSLCLFLFANLAAYIFMMMSVMNFGWGQQSYMLWILMGLSVVYENLVRSEALVEQSACSSPHPGPEWRMSGPGGLWNHAPLSR